MTIECLWELMTELSRSRHEHVKTCVGAIIADDGCYNIALLSPQGVAFVDVCSELNLYRLSDGACLGVRSDVQVGMPCR